MKNVQIDKAQKVKQMKKIKKQAIIQTTIDNVFNVVFVDKFVNVLMQCIKAMDVNFIQLIQKR